MTGSVSIHNLRTVAPRYGELLALLVYLTRQRDREMGGIELDEANAYR